jgi:hypothetical protein
VAGHRRDRLARTAHESGGRGDLSLVAFVTGGGRSSRFSPCSSPSACDSAAAAACLPVLRGHPAKDRRGSDRGQPSAALSPTRSASPFSARRPRRTSRHCSAGWIPRLVVAARAARGDHGLRVGCELGTDRRSHPRHPPGRILRGPPLSSAPSATRRDRRAVHAPALHRLPHARRELRAAGRRLVTVDVSRRPELARRRRPRADGRGRVLEGDVTHRIA